LTSAAGRTHGAVQTNESRPVIRATPPHRVSRYTVPYLAIELEVHPVAVRDAYSKLASLESAAKILGSLLNSIARRESHLDIAIVLLYWSRHWQLLLGLDFQKPSTYPIPASPEIWARATN